jgi:hypothetical protein
MGFRCDLNILRTGIAIYFLLLDGRLQAQHEVTDNESHWDFLTYLGLLILNKSILRVKGTRKTRLMTKPRSE